ncbi:CDP-alcohol phosphatidyltransferase family protein [Thermodesulfobacteriota bacterium]
MNIIPNILSSFRIIIAPFLLLLAWKGYRNIFIGLLLISLLSDAIDGFIARKFNASTSLGTKLDSFGDMAIYLTVPLCAWWLWPEILKKEAVFVLTAIGAYVIPLFAGLIKFKRIPSYHTFGAKIAAIIMCTAILILFITEFTWLFRFAAIFQAIVACEEILITIQLPLMQSNIKSIWHVRKEL